MIGELEKISFATFRVRLGVLGKEVYLPLYAGSTLRGAFGRSFKNVCCPMRQRTCDACILKSTCAFSYTFETPVGGEAKMMRLYPYAPHPFVFHLDMRDRRAYCMGDVFSFTFTLIGKGIANLPYFICAIEEMGKNGLGRNREKMELLDVSFLSSRGEESLCYEGKKKQLNTDFRPETIRDLNRAGGGCRTLTIELTTPLRLVYGGRLVRSLELHMLVRNLLRRVSAVSSFHCECPVELDFKELIARAESIETVSSKLSWYDWKRYSSRQQKFMYMGGLIGKMKLQGAELEELLPLLKIGAVIHAGKGTSFGLGGYRIS